MRAARRGFRPERRRWLAAALLLCAFVTAAPSPAADAPGDALAGPALRAALRAGGLFLYAAVRGGPASDEASDRYTALRQLLSIPPPPGTVLAIASHGNPFRAVAGAPYLAEGEAAVIRPLGASGFRVVSRIPKDGWTALEAR